MVLLAVTAASAAETEGALLEKIYAKLAASFAAGQALGQEGDFLLLASPGFPITRADCQDAYAISRLADQIPQPARTFRPSGSLVSNVYGTILARSEASNFQNMTDRGKALKARRLIYDRVRPGQPTPGYAAYLKYALAHAAAQDALALAQTEQRATGRPLPRGLGAAVAAALKDWETLGARKDFDEAEKALATFYDANVKALFTTLADDCNSAKRSDDHPEPWFPVTATPPPEAWLDDQGWMPFSLRDGEKSLATGPASLPLAAGAASAAPASVSLTLEAKRVRITRPWLDPGIFRGHGWRLLPDTGFAMVSTGNPADRDPGLMPLMVTGVLLSRKLEVQGGGGRGLGAFTLSCPGPQIIGFFCTSVPKAPDPDAQAFRSK